MEYEALGLAAIVPVSTEEREQVIEANDYYVDKDFEYANILRAVVGYKDLPDLSLLDPLVHRLLVELKPLCLAA